MRLLTIVLILWTGSLLPCRSDATEIDDRWGLGVNVGSLISSRPEASLFRGVSAETGWILDLSVSQSRDDRDFVNHFVQPGVDTTFTGPRTTESFFISAGPRIRKFTRPEASLSPYWDAFVHFFERSDRYSDDSYEFVRSGKNIEVGGETGIGIGVEYFLTRWPVSLAAHTNTFRVRVTKAWSESTASSELGFLSTSQSSGTVISSSLTFDPALQVRVYF